MIEKMLEGHVLTWGYGGGMGGERESGWGRQVEEKKEDIEERKEEREKEK